MLTRCKHGSQGGEGGFVFLQDFEFVPELHHGLAHDGLLVLVFALQVGHRHLGSLLVGLEDRAQCRDLFSLGGQQGF